MAERTLQRIMDLQPEAVATLRRHGFVMDKVGPLTDDATELDRWKVLAFSLYTDIVEAATIAEELAGRAVQDDGLDVGAMIRVAAKLACEDHYQQEHLNTIPPCAGAIRDAKYWADKMGLRAAPPLHDDPSGDESDER